MSSAKRHSRATYLLLVAAAAFIAWHLWHAFQYAQIDLEVYRMGGRAVLDGDNPYSVHEIRHSLPFTYPPISALLFVPWALVEPQIARVLWTAVSLACLVGIVVIAYEYATGKAFRHSGPLGAALILVALMLEPVRQTLSFGQINLVLALLLLAGMSGRFGPRTSGALIGIAAAVKLVPALFLVYLFLARRFRTAIAGGATAVTATVAAAVLLPVASKDYWTELFFDASRVGGVAYVSNQSLFGTVVRFSGGTDHVGIAYPILALTLLTIGIGTAVTLRRRGRAMAGDLACAFSALMLSPISWSHHWVWTVPLIIWLWAGLDTPKRARLLAASIFGLFAVAPIWWVPYEHDRELSFHGWQFLAGNSYFFVAVLLISGAVLLLRSPVASRPPVLVNDQTM